MFKLFYEKYEYFATFDQQILAGKLVFRILQNRFSQGSAFFKMVKVTFPCLFGLVNVQLSVAVGVAALERR